MSTSLYQKYRPKTLKAILGQDGAVASLQKLIDKQRIPHVILLTGPSGCGKTTIARILKEHVRCGDADFQEVNAAESKGIDMVRGIQRAVNLSPIDGDSRLWLVDEAHKLTGEAQGAFLKILEDTPKHVYFFLATTDPQKLLKTIHTRAAEIKLTAMPASALRRVLERAVNGEGYKLSEEVLDDIIEAADGSARKALVILEQVGLLETEEEQLKAIQASSVNKDLGIELARELINPRVQWADVAKILKEVVKEDPEGIRYLILGYARSVLLGGGRLSGRAFAIIDIFGRNFYDSKTAGLVAACYEVVTRVK